MSNIFDPGLQPERTELAWRRTALALAVGSLIAVRFLPTAMSNALWALPGLLGVITASSFWIWSRSRAARITELLRVHGDRAALPGAWAITALAALVMLAGALALVVVLAVASWGIA